LFGVEAELAVHEPGESVHPLDAVIAILAAEEDGSARVNSRLSPSCAPNGVSGIIAGPPGGFCLLG
jgi:hypothetical protein